MKGGASGMDYPLLTVAGYDSLASYIESSLGYTRGVDLFAVPYDFRQDLTAMNATGELRRIADVIESGVNASGGGKAVLIGHSMGGLVSTALLTWPDYAEWR
jgi:pimeloyl-ACP methyl ester carboxylesterase